MGLVVSAALWVLLGAAAALITEWAAPRVWPFYGGSPIAPVMLAGGSGGLILGSIAFNLAPASVLWPDAAAAAGGTVAAAWLVKRYLNALATETVSCFIAMVRPVWIMRDIQAAVTEAAVNLSEDELFDLLNRIAEKEEDLGLQEGACRTAAWFSKTSGLFQACRVAGEDHPGAAATDEFAFLRALDLYMKVCDAARERNPERLEAWLKSRAPAQ